MYLRALHPDRDEYLYREAWAWRLKYPRLVRKWDGLKHFRYWFRLMKRRISIGVFTPELIALITLQPRGNDVYEVHVDCERRVSLETLYVALLSLRKTVFEEWKAREVFAGIVSKNQGIIRIAEACGFRRDGIEETYGHTRWIRLRMTDVEYQNQYQSIERNAVEPVLAA